MQNRSQRRDSPLGLGTVGPLVALLFMVLGVVNAATGMSARFRFDAVLTGVVQALAITAAGLLVVVPAMWLYNRYGPTK